MRKKFKPKKKKRKYIKYLMGILLISILFNLFKNIQISKTNESFLKGLLYNSNHHLNYKKNDLIFSNIINHILKIDFSSPISIISKTFAYEETLKEENIFMVNTNEILEKNPRVYIYSSHQLEEYAKEENELNTPNVIIASNLLKEKLNSFNIETIVEEGNIIEFMRVNNYTHSYSYVASRYFIEPVIEKNDFDLIIDLHRDSNKKESSTVTINGKNYAKVLFVIGLENENYQKNLEVTEKINNIILQKYPTLTRGIYKKEGPGVDGVYNQDLNSNMILLELGGYQNTTVEITNTINIMSEIIKQYLETI